MLDDLDDYDTHFTVMNYGDSQLKQVVLLPGMWLLMRVHKSFSLVLYC